MDKTGDEPGHRTVFLVDGTYELFRQHYGMPSDARDTSTTGATRGVLNGVLSLIAEAGAPRRSAWIGVATDHVVESFRNNLWPGYKTSAGMPPLLVAQFPLLEECLEAMGVKVWAMVDLEADDALASAAHVASRDPRVGQVAICSPDKDMAQCVREPGDGDDGETVAHVVQIDRRRQLIYDSAAVEAKFGIPPRCIPDYLALVGDSADGFPGLAGFGAKSAAAVLTRYGRIEDVPGGDWDGVKARSLPTLAARLVAERDLALLFKDLATLRIDESLLNSVDELEWKGPTADFAKVCDTLDAPNLLERAESLAG